MSAEGRDFLKGFFFSKGGEEEEEEGGKSSEQQSRRTVFSATLGPTVVTTSNFLHAK